MKWNSSTLFKLISVVAHLIFLFALMVFCMIQIILTPCDGNITIYITLLSMTVGTMFDNVAGQMIKQKKKKKESPVAELPTLDASAGTSQ
jgi:hypothetical protein